MSFGVWLARRWEEKRKKYELIKKIKRVTKKLQVHQLKRICLDLLNKTSVGEIRQDPKIEEDYEIKKPISDERVYLVFESICENKKPKTRKGKELYYKTKDCFC